MSGMILVTMHGLLIPEQPALDQRWLDQLIALAGVASEIYVVMAPPASKLAAVKQAFYDSGCTHNPNLRPVIDDVSAVMRANERLRKLQLDISLHESNSVVAQAYEARIAELIACNELWMAAAAGDKHEFAAKNVEAFGAPNSDIFAAVCEWYRHWAQGYAESTEPTTARAARTVLAHLPKPQKYQTHITPAAEVFARVRANHFAPGGYIDQLFDGIAMPKHGIVTPKVGDPLLRQLLHKFDTSYRVVESPGDYWCLLYDQKAVGRPANYQLTPEGFMGLVCHEIGSHLLERLNGLRQPLRLLGLGLDHYENGNEGRALVREQIILPDFATFMQTHRQWRRFTGYYYAISLGAGLAKAQTLPFAEVYDAVYAIQYLWALVNKAANAQQTAHDEAWFIVNRSLTGTDGTGGSFYRSLVYLQGNIVWWQAAAKDPNVLATGDLGKFDIANQRHRTLLQKLAIL